MRVSTVVTLYSVLAVYSKYTSSVCLKTVLLIVRGYDRIAHMSRPNHRPLLSDSVKFPRNNDKAFVKTTFSVFSQSLLAQRGLTSYNFAKFRLGEFLEVAPPFTVK